MMRAVSLYALRYEKHSSNDVGGLLNVLSRRGVSERYKKVVTFITSLTVVLWNAHAHCSDWYFLYMVVAFEQFWSESRETFKCQI